MTRELRRRDDPLFLVVCIVVAFVIVQVVVWGWFVLRSHGTDEDRKSSQERTECITRNEGIAIGSALQALAAPPVPTDATPEEFGRSARGLAVARGLGAADRLQHPRKSCPK